MKGRIETVLALLSLLIIAAPEGDSVARRARSLEPMANWFSDRDYPAEAIRRRAEGRVRFRLTIDERGNVEACTILASSNDSALDAATCSVLTIRGRFRPARNAAGRAVKDSVTSRVRWVLPGDNPPMPFEPVRFVSSIHATAQGEVSCSTNTLWEAEAATPGECGLFASSGIARALREARIDATVTAISTLVPEGMSAPGGDAGGYGARLVDAEAELTIAADGRIAACRSIRHQIAGGPYQLPPMPPICDTHAPGNGPMFEPAGAPGAVRRVTLSFTVFGRGGPRSPEP
jgi:TonB family protein